MAQPTAYEQYVLELVNRARGNPGAEAARLGIGLNDGLAAGTLSNSPQQPLVFNPKLIAAAQGHSAWMLANNNFSHTGANGSSPGDRMGTAGYGFTGSWSWGENIAIQYGSGTVPSQATSAALEAMLFKSPEHRTNILNAKFREVGIGVAGGTYQGQSAVDATQDFAFSGSGSFLTGVAYTDLNGDGFYEPGEGLGGLSVQVKSGTGTTYQTTTWDAGGYQLKLPAGAYQVAFSGGALATPVTKTANAGSQNLELDLVRAPGGTTAPGTPAIDTLDIAVAEDAWTGDAQFTVSVDGKPVSGIQTAHVLHSTRGDGHVLLTGNWGAGQHDVQIAFINDAWGGSAATDRNLYVASVALNGTTYAGTAGAFLANGSKDFLVGGSAPKGVAAPDKLVLHLSEDAWSGNAQFTVSVDGKTLDTAEAVTVLHASGTSQDFTFTGSFGAGPHDVGVSFLNDAWGGTAATDRNLYVNSANFDGHSYAGAALLSNGTAHFTVSA